MTREQLKRKRKKQKICVASIVGIILAIVIFCIFK